RDATQMLVPRQVNITHEFPVLLEGGEYVLDHGTYLFRQYLAGLCPSPQFGAHVRPAPREKRPGQVLLALVVIVHCAQRYVGFTSYIAHRRPGHTLLAEHADGRLFDALFRLLSRDPHVRPRYEQTTVHLILSDRRSQGSALPVENQILWISNRPCYACVGRSQRENWPTPHALPQTS